MIELRLPRPIYVVVNIASMFVQVFSRLLNAALLGGSTYQTTSARAHIETSWGWRIGRRVINALFFWQADHCRAAWDAEVHNARKTLERAGL
jgi:hypothetical protein